MQIDLHPAAAELTRVVAGTRPDQLGASTPCPEMDVERLLAHVAALAMAFRDAARKIVGPTTQTAPQDAPAELPSDWAAVIPQRLADLADAWDAPEAWAGECTAGGVTLPSTQTAGFANDELVVHAWDLAVATGQAVHPAEANLQAAYALASSIPADSPARAGGLFGPIVEVPADASLLDRTLGATGRDPSWRPPAR